MAPIKRIAVLRALYLGDLLLAVPALRALRAGFPDAEISLIGLPWSVSFVGRFGHYLDRFVEFGGFPGLRDVTLDPERSRRFVDEQRAYGYDLVIQMHGNGKTSNPCAVALGGRMTVGYYLDDPPAELVLAAPYPEDRPEVLRNLDLALLIGCPDMGSHLEFPLYAEDRIQARRLLRPMEGERCPWVAIHPGAKFPVRSWSTRSFAQVADDLVSRFGARIVLTGGPQEVEVAQAVAEVMDAPAVNLAGRTSLGTLAAFLQQVDVLICNDTGPAHVAEAVGTPTVRIYGPSLPERWAALDHDRHRVAQHPSFPAGREGWHWPSADAVTELAADLLHSRLPAEDLEPSLTRKAGGVVA